MADINSSADETSLYRVARVSEKSGKIRFYSRSGKSQEGLYRVRGFLNPCSKSVRSQGILSSQIAANYFIRCFRMDKAILFSKLSEPSLCLLIPGQNNHPVRSVKIALQSVKSQWIFLFQGVATLL